MDVKMVEGPYPDQNYIENFEQGLYSDNTPFVKSQYGRIGNTEMTVIVRSPMDFHAAMMTARYLKGAGKNNRVSLYMPYAVGARQDRSNKTGDVLFAAKYYADIINMIGFDKVTIVDPHSEVYPALLNNCHVITAADVLAEQDVTRKIRGMYSGVIAPDAGAAKRAWQVAEYFNIPMVQGWKHRDVSDGKITGFGFQPLGAGHYLMVDDICDGGGTFNGLMDAIALGLGSLVTADLYVTHGLFTNGLVELRKRFQKIITTDSCPQYHVPDHVIKIKELFNV